MLINACHYLIVHGSANAMHDIGGMPGQMKQCRAIMLCVDECSHFLNAQCDLVLLSVLLHASVVCAAAAAVGATLLINLFFIIN